MPSSPVSPPPAENVATVVGISNNDEAKIGGITPAVLSFKGRNWFSPPVIFKPTWRLGYWIRMRRCARSRKTTK